MGIRGLTTYIESNADIYLKDYQLRDTHLVIDGNSLCANLYKRQTKCNDTFGGDYDKFGTCIRHFFTMLKQCNVTPIVIMDGGYESRKMKTVYSRLRDRLKALKYLHPIDLTTFPLFVREAFKDVVVKLNVTIIRADFEADFDIASVARKLDCPVLSYDSDFYIFDVKYIPFTMLNFFTTKLNPSETCMRCKIYTVQNFLNRYQIDKSLLPLMATILGNDYVEKKVFHKFFEHIKLRKQKQGQSHQHQTIHALTNWMKNETYTTAVTKILNRMKKEHRPNISKQIKRISEGYICNNSNLFPYLNLDQTPNSVTELNSEFSATNSDLNDSNSDSGSGSDTDNESDEELNKNTEIWTNFESKTVDILNTDWFRSNFRKCDFPSMFMDILMLETVIYIPQVQDITNLHSLDICLPILRAICKILLSNQSDKFIYLALNQHGNVTKYVIEVSELSLPKVEHLENMNSKEALNTILLILNISEKDFELISTLPKTWQLYFLSAIYWYKNSTEPKVKYPHISTLILCLLNLNIVDTKIAYSKLKNNFIRKYATKIQNIIPNDTELSTNELKFIDLIKMVNDNECLCFIASFVNYFQKIERIKSIKQFSLSTIDAFAQFQSCLLYIKHLNALLSFPLEDFDICMFYNGTYIYNLYVDLTNKSNIDKYVEILLKKCPILFRIYKKTDEILRSILNISSAVTDNKLDEIRKKYKKRKPKIKESLFKDIENNCDDVDDELYDDVNNKFSILSIS